MEPEHIMASGWPNEHAASLLVPSVSSTCKGSNKVIDFCIVSASIFSFCSIEPVVVPWGPHIGLHVQVSMSPANTLVRSLVEPLALPMDTFHANWK